MSLIVTEVVIMCRVSNTEQKSGNCWGWKGHLEVSGPAPLSPYSKQSQLENCIRVLIIEHEEKLFLVMEWGRFSGELERENS